MNCTCRNCKRTDLKKEEMRKDSSVYKGICKKCWSGEQALTRLLKRVEAAPFRYKACSDCDRYVAKRLLKCPECSSVNFESIV